MTSHEITVPRVFVTMQMLIIFILCSVLLVVFVVPPYKVMEAVKQSEAKATAETAKVSAHVEEVMSEMDRRKPIISSIERMESALADRPRLSLEKEEFEQWRAKAKELNPQLELPPLNSVVVK